MSLTEGMPTGFNQKRSDTQPRPKRNNYVRVRKQVNFQDVPCVFVNAKPEDIFVINDSGRNAHGMDLNKAVEAGLVLYEEGYFPEAGNSYCLKIGIRSNRVRLTIDC